MRRPKKASASPNQSADIERMYRTIPTGSRTTQVVTSAPARPQGVWKRRIKRLLIALVLVALLCGLWVGGKFVYNGVKIFGWQGFLSLFTTNRLEGEREGRVNILLAGNSADDPGHQGATLTDSIMVMSIDPKAHTAFIVSIPRDLYVDIPGNGYAKINEVYQDGQQQAIPELAEGGQAGMQLLQRVVSRDLGIPIHYYALVNYTALQQAVDTLGGVDITVNSTDSRGLYDPSPDLQNGRQPLVDLPNGPAHIDGRQALNLARARGHAARAYGYDSGDFTRTELQRQILVAIKEKASSGGTLSNPIKLGQLFDAMGSNVETDLDLGEARRLYTITKPITNDKITSTSINGGPDAALLENDTNRYGQFVLVPRAGVDDYSEIQEYIISLIGTAGSSSR